MAFGKRKGSLGRKAPDTKRQIRHRAQEREFMDVSTQDEMEGK